MQFKKLLSLGLVVALTACSRSSHNTMVTKLASPAKSLVQYEPSAAPALDMAISAPADARKPDNTLAYTHEIQVEITREHLTQQLDAVKSACISDKQASCTILSVDSSNSSSIPSGNISMRLAPGKVDSMIDLAGQHGKVTSRSTSAEDLAPELGDTAQKLATLTSYRDRLNGFMTKDSLTADKLIAVAKELSSTQAQIEELSRARSELKRRVDTDLLNLHFTVPAEEYRQQQTPVMDSIRYFGQHFLDAVSSVIDFFAYLLPWVPVILLGFFGLRKLWQVIRRKPASQSLS